MRQIYVQKATQNLQQIEWQFSIFFKLFHDDFNDNVCRDGMSGIDCETVIPEKRLTPRSDRNPPV